MKNRREFIAQSGALGLLGLMGKVSIDGVPKPSLIKPKLLSKGDTIAIMAPGGAVFSSHYIDTFKKVLSSLGFNPVVGRTCFKRDGQFGGTDQERAEEFMYFIEKLAVKAIFTMRGGSGCARILPMLDFDKIAANPKVIMGFSDITSIINAVYAQSGLVGFHGPVGYSSWGDFTVDAFKNVCTTFNPFIFKTHPESNPKALKSGIAEGTLVGGNLTVLTTLAGTPYLPMFDKQIVFLEDIDEEPYAIDRCLTQLLQCGFLEKASGIILGDFKRCTPEEPDKSHSLLETFNNNLLPLGIPIMMGADFGHTTHKWTLPVGVKARLDADKLNLRLLESAVL